MIQHNVRQARVELGLSQVQLSERAGVPRDRLRALESGGNVTLETLEKIVAHLPNLKELTIGGVDVEVTGVNVETLRAAIAEADAANRRVLAMLTAISARSPEAAGAAPAPEPSTGFRPALENRLLNLEAKVNALQRSGTTAD
jgi:transcriptional regulator with XRE-family HTH domain